MFHTLMLKLKAPDPLGRDSSAILFLPTGTFALQDALQQLHVESEDDIQSMCVSDTKYRWGKTITLEDSSLDEVNYLAQRLEKLEELQSNAYMLLLQKRLPNTEHVLTAGEMINLTANLDSIPVIPCKGKYNLGSMILNDCDLLASSIPQINWDKIPEEVLALLDPNAVADKAICQSGGRIYKGDFYCLDQYRPQEVYDRVNLPSDYQPDLHIFTVETLTGHVRQYISMPFYDRYEGQVPPWKDSLACIKCRWLDEIYSYQDSIEEIEQISEQISALPKDELLHFKAALSAQGEFPLSTIREILETYHDYEFDPQCLTPEEYASNLLDHTSFHPMIKNALHSICADAARPYSQNRGILATWYGTVAKPGLPLYPEESDILHSLESGPSM